MTVNLVFGFRLHPKSLIRQGEPILKRKKKQKLFNYINFVYLVDCVGILIQYVIML